MYGRKEELELFTSSWKVIPLLPNFLIILSNKTKKHNLTMKEVLYRTPIFKDTYAFCYFGCNTCASI